MIDLGRYLLLLGLPLCGDMVIFIHYADLYVIIIPLPNGLRAAPPN